MSFPYKYISEGFVLAALVIAVFVNALWWSNGMLFDSAPDEYLHIKVPRFYVEYRRLPVFLKDPDMGYSCRANGVDCAGSYALFANYGYFVNAATMVVLGSVDYRNGRVGSMLMAVVFAVLVYGVSREIFLKDRLTRLAVSVVTLTWPMVTFVSAYINSDIAGLVTNLAVFYFCWELVSKERMGWFKLGLGGVVVGLLALSRLNQYPILFLVPWSLWVRKEKYGGSWGRVFKQAGYVGMVGVLTSGWWFVRNWLLYRDPIGNSTSWNFWWTISTRYSPMKLGVSPLELFFGHAYGTNWLRSTFESFVGAFGYMAIWYPKWIYFLVLGLMLAAGMGIAMKVSEIVYINNEVRSRLLFWAGVVMVAIVTFVLSAWTSYVNDYQPQGRYWFAFLYPLVVGVVVGLMNLRKGRGWKTGVGAFLIGFFVLLNLWGRILAGAAV